MKKLVMSCFLFIVTILSLILTINLGLLILNPNFITKEIGISTMIIALLCSVSIFYITVFINILLYIKPKQFLLETVEVQQKSA